MYALPTIHFHATTEEAAVEALKCMLTTISETLLAGVEADPEITIEREDVYPSEELSEDDMRLTDEDIEKLLGSAE